MNTPNIYRRILNIMGELDYIQKGEKTVNGQYRFVSHDAVTSKVHPLLVKHGVAIVPSVESLQQDGNRTTVKLAVGFVNVDDSKDSFFTCHYGFGVDSGDKGPGKAISYAFKYALLKTFCLETGDDPDNDANAVYEAPKCLEFDLAIPSELALKVPKFLEHCAASAGKSVETVKKEAVKRMDNFLDALRAWKG